MKEPSTVRDSEAMYAHSSWGLVYWSRSHCRTTAFRVKVRRKEKGRESSSPFFLLYEAEDYWMAANMFLI
jgi:hypothetical protein